MPTRRDEPFGRLGDTWDACLDLVETSGLPVCWDFGHVYLSILYGKCDPMPPAEFLARVGHVHAHDVVRNEDGGYSDHVMPPGVGECPMDDYAQLLAASGFDGWILFELFVHHYRSREHLAAELVPPGRKMLEVLGG